MMAPPRGLSCMIVTRRLRGIPPLDKEQLEQKRTLSKQRFDELVSQKEAKTKELELIDNELLRLQGEYRLIEDLLKPEETDAA